MNLSNKPLEVLSPLPGELWRPLCWLSWEFCLGSQSKCFFSYISLYFFQIKWHCFFNNYFFTHIVIPTLDKIITFHQLREVLSRTWNKQQQYNFVHQKSLIRTFHNSFFYYKITFVLFHSTRTQIQKMIWFKILSKDFWYTKINLTQIWYEKFNQKAYKVKNFLKTQHKF